MQSVKIHRLGNGDGLARLTEKRQLPAIACIREYSNSKTATGSWKRFMEIQKLAAEYSGLQLTPGVLAESMRLVHS